MNMIIYDYRIVIFELCFPTFGSLKLVPIWNLLDRTAAKWFLPVSSSGAEVVNRICWLCVDFWADKAGLWP